MKDVYEQGKAEELGVLNWDWDPEGIRYPAVSSCVTITYYYDSPSALLVGAHFGLRDKRDAPVTLDFVYSTLVKMHSKIPQGVTAKTVLLLGNIYIWEMQNGFHHVQMLRQEAQRRLGGVGQGRAVEYNTGGFEQVEIEVHVDGRINIKDTKGGHSMQMAFSSQELTMTAFV